MDSIAEEIPGTAATCVVSRACLKNFDRCIEHTTGQDEIRMQTRLADFKLWVDNVGATAEAKASLDWRFRERPDDIHYIRELLSLLKELLYDFSEGARRNANLGDVLANIDATVDSLAFIGVQIRRSGRKSRLRKADESYVSKRDEYRKLRAHLVCIVTARPTEFGSPKDEGTILRNADYFSRLTLSPIQDRLVEANLRRRHRFVEAQRHSQGLKEAPMTNVRTEITHRSVKVVVADPVAESIPSHTAPMLISVPYIEERKVPATSASGLESRFPGLATKRKASSTVTRITNITAAARYPKARLPAETDQKLFQCPCCCQAIPVADMEDINWRKHLANDLCPYTCFITNCPTPFSLFVTQEAWNEHVLADHDPQWQCPLCEGDAARYERLSEFITHAMTAHDAESDELEFLISDAEVNVFGITKCPLCDSEGPEDSPDLVEHVLQHVHEFSLRSLPWPSDPVFSLDKTVGTFNMEHAVNTYKDDGGTESTFDVAGWVETANHMSGFGDNIAQVNDSILPQPTSEDNTVPKLQLCKYDTISPQDHDHSTTSHDDVDNDYFSHHEYFKDVSSAGTVSSEDSHSSHTISDSTGHSNRSKGYVFRIDELSENPQAVKRYDEFKRWLPSIENGFLIQESTGITDQWWHCDHRSIRALSSWSPANETTPYKTVSAIYSAGSGFHILNGNAVNLRPGEDWQPLKFDWVEGTYTSSMNFNGAQFYLRGKSSGKRNRWQDMLFPNIYHGHDDHGGQSGLIGDLGIFLSLLALSIKPQRLMTELPNMMHEGSWQEHSKHQGRIDKRGVIATIYAYGDEYDQLKALEEGKLGMYYK